MKTVTPLTSPAGSGRIHASILVAFTKAKTCTLGRCNATSLLMHGNLELEGLAHA